MADDQVQPQQQDSQLPGQLIPPQDQPIPTNGFTPAGMQALQQLRQPNNQPPSNVPRTPNVVDLIKNLIAPSTQSPNLLQRAPSRLDHFENFLGNFLTSFAQGMSTPPGPGANLRAASAAMMAPYQRNVQQFQLQQQAQEAQARIGQQQAQAGLAGAEAGRQTVEATLAPIQLQLNAQIRQSQLDLENMWRNAMINQGQQKIDLTKVHQQFTDSIKQQQTDLQKQVETGKLNIAQELARYNTMDKASQITYRAAMSQALQTKLIQAQQALDMSNKLKTVQATQDAVKAANDYNIFARIGRSLGLESDLGMPLPELTAPGLSVGTPAATPSKPASQPGVFTYDSKGNRL